MSADELPQYQKALTDRWRSSFKTHPILLSLSHLKLSKLRIPVRKISALLVCTSAALFFQVRLSFASMIQSQ